MNLYRVIARLVQPDEIDIELYEIFGEQEIVWQGNQEVNDILRKLSKYYRNRGDRLGNHTVLVNVMKFMINHPTLVRVSIDGTVMVGGFAVGVITGHYIIKLISMLGRAARRARNMPASPKKKLASPKKKPTSPKKKRRVSK